MTKATIRALAALTDISHRRRLFSRTMTLILSGAILNGLFWQLFSDPVVAWVFGPQWAGAIPTFRILGWASVGYVMTHGTATVLLAQGKYILLASCRIGGVVLLSAILFLLCQDQNASAQSFAIATVATMLIYGAVLSLVAVYSLKAN
jgi:O-antigen/teichoic acid export membrane protein